MSHNADQQSSGPWAHDLVTPAFPPLTSDERADVCVIGAGIAGLTTALLLVREGRTVVVLDDGPVGGGESGRTTAHLSAVLRVRYHELERLHGATGAQHIAASHMEAVNLIERIAAGADHACAFARRDGYLFWPPGAPVDELDRELAAAQRAGLPGVERVARAPLSGFDTGPCLRFPRQAQFHPLQYLAHVAREVGARGGRLFCGSHAVTFAGGSPARVTTADGRVVEAKAIVVATNTPVNDVVTMHTKQAPYRTYAIVATVPAGTVPPALFWDTEDPYHYVRAIEPGRARSAPGMDYLLIGGEDHKTGQADDAEARYRRLEEWGRARFTGLTEVVHRWSGQVIEPIDGVAFIGVNPGDRDNVFVATGDAGNGMTHGTIAGMLLSDAIMGRQNPWATLYDPARKTLRAAKEFVRENLDVARRYAEWLTPTTVTDADQIANGSGAVVRDGLSKLAIYRDENGVLHRHSAACTHLGCVVHWNSGERTWDCPCHGSRYDRFGHVINGPAVTDLAAR